jgi:hypothetical protein
MKIIHSLGLFFALLFVSCIQDSNLVTIDVAVPVTIGLEEFRSAVDILPPREVEKTNKIYVYKDYIFVTDNLEGVHVIDNSNPSSPVSKAFINIPANEDISIKDNYLYADSAVDLLVFDISNTDAIEQVSRLEDVFERYNYHIPEGVDRVKYEDMYDENKIVIGWEVVKEKVDSEELFWLEQGGRLVDDVVMFAESDSGAGVGGSLARFQIVKDYLYTVGTYEMDVFDIGNLALPEAKASFYVGWNIETMFYADDYLYLGSTNGMYIYSLENPELPSYVSEFTHWEGCDPVVVDGDYAYLTLRGGNSCGQLESILEVIDIREKSNPTLAARYTLENPYGLGIRGNNLYVCDGSAGLKLFDKTIPDDLEFLKSFEDMNAKDVIPLEDKLILIAENVLYQYQYLENDLDLLSVYSLDF